MKKTALLMIFLFLSLTVFANDTVKFYLKLIKNGSSSVEIKDSTLETSLDKIIFSIPTSVDNPKIERSKSTASFGLDWNLYANYDANGILDNSCSMNLYFVTSAEDFDNGYMLINTENNQIGLNYNVQFSDTSSFSYNESQEEVKLTGSINAPDGKDGSTKLPLDGMNGRKLTMFDKIPLNLITPIKGNAVVNLELLAPWGDVTGADGTVTGSDYHFMQGQYTGYVFIETVIY